MIIITIKNSYTQVEKVELESRSMSNQTISIFLRVGLELSLKKKK